MVIFQGSTDILKQYPCLCVDLAYKVTCLKASSSQLCAYTICYWPSPDTYWLSPKGKMIQQGQQNKSEPPLYKIYNVALLTWAVNAKVCWSSTFIKNSLIGVQWLKVAKSSVLNVCTQNCVCSVCVIRVYSPIWATNMGQVTHLHQTCGCAGV